MGPYCVYISKGLLSCDQLKEVGNFNYIHRSTTVHWKAGRNLNGQDFTSPSGIMILANSLRD